MSAVVTVVMTSKRWHVVLLVTFLAILVWSGINPRDQFVWFLEVLPAMIGAAILLVLYRRVKLTMLLYGLIWLHALVLMVGGHWTYAEMPLFSLLRDEYGLARNYYDRLGHVMQGFVPAMIAREIFIRSVVINGRGWLLFLVCCVALAVSAFYEFVEWWVAVWSGTAAEAFLATQGDVWDTQWDMFLALSGALASQLLLARWHDLQLASMRQGKGSEQHLLAATCRSKPQSRRWP